MAYPDSQQEYARRMARVVAHIDDHLDETLDLATLAEIAHFSPYHFHRLFSAWMGERLGDYLRRRRLEAAAQRLIIQSQRSVLDIALSVGFGSAEAFSRAFKLHFNVTPSEWRSIQGKRSWSDLSIRHLKTQDRNPDQIKHKINQAIPPHEAHHEDLPTHIKEFVMNVQLIDRKPVTIAYLRHHGPYGAPVQRFWFETVVPWMTTHNLMQAARYGIGQDDPSITAPEQCRYDAGIEVPEDFIVSGQALKTTLPGGRYAAMPFKGTLNDVNDAWNALLREWLPNSGMQFDARPCFEYYGPDASYDPATGVFSCQICIPVRPL